MCGQKPASECDHRRPRLQGTVSCRTQRGDVDIMRYAVTGAAGFIGSHVCMALLQAGHEVVATDCFTPYYPRELKERNLSHLSQAGAFHFKECRVGELTSDDLSECDAILHLAAQPGVRNSWSEFDLYLDLNLAETHKLYMIAREANVPRFVFASSSSVYGDASTYPTSEETPARPLSPYGVTKIAGEHLLRAHSAADGLSVAALRFFTVYGPGQRPDMAIQRLISLALRGGGPEFMLFGDGLQRRDFTFVSDVVAACIAAMQAPKLPTGLTPINVGGSGDTSMLELITLIEEETGRPIPIKREPAQRGDARRTGADASLARELLGWEPMVRIREGIERQVAFEKEPSLGNWVQPQAIDFR